MYNIQWNSVITNSWGPPEYVRYNREVKSSKFWSNIEQFENIKQIVKIKSNMAIVNCLGQ